MGITKKKLTSCQSDSSLASIKILNDNDHIKQVHFIRQAWGEIELEFGSVLKHCKSLGYDMIEKTNGNSDWVEHSAYFTFGPTIYKKEIASADCAELRK